LVFEDWDEKLKQEKATLEAQLAQVEEQQQA